MCRQPIPAVSYGFKINKNGERVRNLRLLDMKHTYYGFGLEELKERFGDNLVLLPCGHCYSCSVQYAKQWANRIMMEATLFGDNCCFLTLTYSDNYLPGSLEKRPLQLFMKRLRKEVGQVRFFACGEVGEGKGSREGFNPHYHVIIFGYNFPDKVPLQRSGSGLIIYRSSFLEKLWPYGLSSIGSVSPESAQYVAKYSLKRKTSGIDKGEFVLMSRRPGIGSGAYSSDIWKTDRIYLNGKSFKPPRFFEKVAEKVGDNEYVLCKFQREDNMKDRVSSKFMYGLDREEDALIREDEDRIFKDCLKVRLV